LVGCNWIGACADYFAGNFEVYCQHTISYEIVPDDERVCNQKNKNSLNDKR